MKSNQSFLVHFLLMRYLIRIMLLCQNRSFQLLVKLTKLNILEFRIFYLVDHFLLLIFLPNKFILKQFNLLLKTFNLFLGYQKDSFVISMGFVTSINEELQGIRCKPAMFLPRFHCHSKCRFLRFWTFFTMLVGFLSESECVCLFFSLFVLV